MSYQALARKWRPQTFVDIIGQPTIVRTLSNAIEQKRIHHAYLFSGVRGVGKTTTARILAKALNCVKGPTVNPCNECVVCREITEGIDLDVREIDAATYSKAEDVREIREVLQYHPARDRYRIFIIDEVHSLSAQAWNAFLKQIEEPPPYVIFMMATTELQKVPATILSRVQQMLFRAVTVEDIIGRIQEICRQEQIEIDEQAVALLAARGEGSVRDSLSLLDQIIAFSGRTVTAEDIFTILGISDSRLLGRLVAQIQDGDHGALLSTLHEAAEGGRDFKLLYRDLLSYLRNLLVIAGGADLAMVSGSAEEIAAMRDLAGRFEYSELLRILNLMIRDDELISRTEQPRLAVEVAILKAATLPRLRSVEQALSGGADIKPALKPASPKSATPANPVSASRTRVPAPPPEPQRVSAQSETGMNELARLLVEEMRKQRPAAASYLEQAKGVRVEPRVITFEYDAADAFAAQYLMDAANASLLNEIGERVGQRPVAIEILQSGHPETGKTERRITDDPVIKAFAKHLGGEVV